MKEADIWWEKKNENEKEFFIYCLFGSIYANGN